MSINPFPEYKAHTFAMNKLIEEFEASKSRSDNATSLCAKVREHDATILSTELISPEDLNFFRITHSEALQKASDMIRTFVQPAYLDTLSLSGVLGTISNLLCLSIENSRNLILPQSVSVDSSSLLSLRIGLPSWSADFRRSNEEKSSAWSLQGLPRRSEPKDLLDPLFDARTAAFNSFRHYGRSLFDPLFDLNPEPIKTTATIHQDGEIRASLVNQTEKISITRLVSHERILATFKMLIADDVKLDPLAPLSNDSSAPRSSSSTPSIAHDKSYTSKVDSIMQLAYALLSSPGDLNASALFDSIALSGIESLSPAFLGVEEHFEEMVKRFYKTELTQGDPKLKGRKIDTDNPDLFKHYLQSNLVYYLKTYEKNSYEGIDSVLESAMKNERRLWEGICFRNDEKKGAEVDLSLQMVALGFEWFNEDVETGRNFPFVCQYPSLVGSTNVLGGCIGSLHAHSCSSNDPSVFAGALSFLSSQNDSFIQRERERNVQEENASSAIDVAALKAMNRLTSVLNATEYSALSFASSWKGPSSKVKENNLSPVQTESLPMIRRLLRLSAILCAYNDQLDEEAVFVSKLRSKVNKNFDLSPMLVAIRCFSDKESPTMQEGIWDARFRMEMNKDLQSLKSLSTLGTLTPDQLKEQDTVFRSLLTEFVPETLNQKLEWKFKTLLFGSQRVVNEGIASLIIHGVLQRLMNQSVNETSTRRVTSSLNVFSSDAASIAFSPRSNLTTGPDRRNIESFLERCRNFRHQSMKTYVVSPPPLPSDTHLIHLESMQAVSSPTGGSPGRKMMTISESSPFLPSFPPAPSLPSSPPPPPLSLSRLSLSSSPSRLSSSSPLPFTTSSAFVRQVSGSTPSPPPPPQRQLLPQPFGSPPTSICAVCKKPGKLRCTQCLVALYCGKECEGIAWKEHKKYCKKASNVIQPPSPSSSTSILFISKEEQDALTSSGFGINNDSSGKTFLQSIDHALGFPSGIATEKILIALRNLSSDNDDRLLRFVTADNVNKGTPFFFVNAKHGSDIIEEARSKDIYSNDAFKYGSAFVELALNPFTNLFHLGFSIAFPTIGIKLFIVKDKALCPFVKKINSKAPTTYSFLTRFRCDEYFQIYDTSNTESSMSPAGSSPVRVSKAAETNCQTCLKTSCLCHSPSLPSSLVTLSSIIPRMVNATEAISDSVDHSTHIITSVAGSAVQVAATSTDAADLADTASMIAGEEEDKTMELNERQEVQSTSIKAVVSTTACCCC